MSVINKKPFIVEVLETLTETEVATLKGLINGSDSGYTFYSLVPNTPNLLTKAEDVTIIDRVLLEINGLGIAQKLYKGYLVYNNDYCVLISYSNDKSQELKLLNMTKVEGDPNWKCKITNCELSITELRSELDDLSTAEGAEIIEVVNKGIADGVIPNANTNIAPLYNSNLTYSEGDFVIYNDVLYVANQDISVAEEWNSAHWTAITVSAALGSAGMENPMTTAGDIIYGGPDGVPTRLAKGTAGQVLAMNSGATAPEWQNASSTTFVDWS